MRRFTRIALLVVATCGSSIPSVAVTFDWAVVGNPGNAADDTGFGSVDYSYRISKHEVTVAQYADFLNAVASTDPFELYEAAMDEIGLVRSGTPGNYTYAVKPPAMGQGVGGTDVVYGSKPVRFVSWFDAIRFSNWMHNGQGNGDTESGAYTLLGGAVTPSNSDLITRNPEARVFLTSEDEWYKAAYHKNDGATSNYWQYPTGTDDTPDENPPSSDSGNSVNSTFAGGGVADVDAYLLSASPYGTVSQGGNVREWIEDLAQSVRNETVAIVRGGDFLNCTAECSSAISRSSFNQGIGNTVFGFRVGAAIPEPNSCALALAALCLAMGRRQN